MRLALLPLELLIELALHYEFLLYFFMQIVGVVMRVRSVRRESIHRIPGASFLSAPCV